MLDAAFWQEIRNAMAEALNSQAICRRDGHFGANFADTHR